MRENVEVPKERERERRERERESRWVREKQLTKLIEIDVSIILFVNDLMFSLQVRNADTTRNFINEYMHVLFNRSLFWCNSKFITTFVQCLSYKCIFFKILVSVTPTSWALIRLIQKCSFVCISCSQYFVVWTFFVIIKWGYWDFGLTVLQQMQPTSYYNRITCVE